VNDRFHVQLFRREKWKSFAEIKPRLRAEH
jgi:hypothetical protein